MKYPISPLAVGIGLLCCAVTAIPALATPTGAINSHTFRVKTYQPEPNGYQRPAEFKVDVQYTISNPHPYDVDVAMSEFVSGKQPGQDYFNGLEGSGVDRFAAPRNSTVLGGFHGTAPVYNGWTYKCEATVFIPGELDRFFNPGPDIVLDANTITQTANF